MKKNAFLPALVMSVSALIMASCAAKPQKPEPKWEVASEQEVATALDLAVAKEAKSYLQVKKDGVLMFCKRYKEVGSNLPTIKCITEAQLRVRVENMQKYRDDMRNRAGKCPMGPLGCQAGQ